VFIPVFQKDFDDDGSLLSYPRFEYRYAEATQDEQLAWSMEPDYVLELNGIFYATTNSIIKLKEDE
jgi:hypothetical protein